MDLKPGKAPSFFTELIALCRQAAPIMLTQAGVASMGVVDVAVVGRAGAVALAAVGLANGVFFAWVVLGIGIMLGLDPLMSQALGANDPARARHFVWQGVWLSLLASIVVCPGLIGTSRMLESFGIESNVAGQARSFIAFRAPGVPILLCVLACTSYLQSTHRTAWMVVAIAAANVANFLADLWLVFGGWRVPALGAAGAAIASTLSLAAQLAILAYAVGREKRRVQRRPVVKDLLQAAKVGIPVGLQMCAEVGVFAGAAVVAGRMGKAQVASHQIAIILASLTYTVAIGIGNAASVRVGRAVGGRRKDQVRRSGLAAFVAGGCFMSVSAAIFWTMPQQLARAMTNQRDLVQSTAPLLIVAAAFQVFDGIQAVGAGVLRGAGVTRFTFVANVIGHYLIGAPIALFLGLKLGWGVVGLWWGLSAGLVAVALALVVRFTLLSKGEIAPLGDPGLLPVAPLPGSVD